jgi:hypothetical protein
MGERVDSVEFVEFKPPPAGFRDSLSAVRPAMAAHPAVTVGNWLVRTGHEQATAMWWLATPGKSGCD